MLRLLFWVLLPFCLLCISLIKFYVFLRQRNVFSKPKKKDSAMVMVKRRAHIEQHRVERYRKRNFVSNPFFEGFYECENPPKHQLHFLNQTLICYISVSLNDSIVAFLSSNHPHFVRPLDFQAIPLHILLNE